ncbi:MAG: NAD(P)/FAD-dependent oxidoreductase [Alphaproteobacteria bacterium]|nr:NAD(P)/FAD-dependent oxidoreductase [Alphaproteobacteria bacterium]
MKQQYDVIIVGAGAAGLMCAIEAGKRRRRVLLIDHAAKPAQKIRISGGGRCNFTNIYARPENYISNNRHFCKSALERYQPEDFIALVKKHNIAFHEKTLGQLFCDGSAQQIIDMLLAEAQEANVELRLQAAMENIQQHNGGFSASVSGERVNCEALVIASGGASIPKMGATEWGYGVAKHFGIKLVPPRAGLVPFTFSDEMLHDYKLLSGVAVANATAVVNKQGFTEAVLFTHRGLSGPAALQISSYWREGDPVTVNLLPDLDVFAWLKQRKIEQPKQEVHTAMAEILPKRLALQLCADAQCNGRLADLSHAKLQALAMRASQWHVVPAGTEGYRTAEVTLGGVDTTELSSKTMEAKIVPGLYFIGEVVDVTGWLGGYNFQWAWASGFAAGQAV